MGEARGVVGGRGSATPTVTFLFTDIEGSTARWERDGAAMAGALAAHDEQLRSVVQGHRGEVFKHTGDGVCAVFASAQDAVVAAVGAQRVLGLPVRMGVHTGVAESRGGDFFGPVLNRTARIMGAGHGGQVVMSAATADLVEGVVLTDLGEHRLRDVPVPVHLFQAGEEQFAPLVTVSVFRTNLREPLSSFVGRGQELTDLGVLLGECRLLTMTGVGGTGKTRLALRAGVAHRELFPDGVWVLELAALSDPAAISSALSSALEVVAPRGQAVMDRVVEFLSDRRGLLIVDNCEHVLDASADLVEGLLGACSSLVVLATSRESLAIPGEHVFVVPTMSDVTGGLSDAVRLFVERVREERPGFELTEANRGSVETICGRLDDLPLAIELAAARAAAMGTGEIARRLDERFRLLTAGQRGRVERHKTLGATVEWSYTLLDEDERALFDALSVFAGTFDLDAVFAVGAVDGADHYEVIDAIGSLVAKSMVVVDEHPMLGTRYRLLETLRAFGHERLDAAGQLDTARTRHAAHYRRLAQAAAVEMYGPSSARSGQQLLTDAAEHRAALAWFIVDGRTDDALAHAANLINTSVWRGWREPGEWLRSALATPGADASPFRPAALAASAYYASDVDYDLPQAERLALESIATRQDLPVAGEPVTLSAEIAMWYIAAGRGDLDDAAHWAASQYERARRRQDTGNIIVSLVLSVLASSYLGRGDEARKTAEELERHLGPDPDPLPAWGLSFAWGTAWAEDDPQLAVEHFKRGGDEALAGGLPFLAHLCQRDTFSVGSGHLAPPLAAIAARDVLANMWEDRVILNITVAVVHIVVVCVRAARLREAAIIDGWLGPGTVPLAPHYAARLETARREIDAQLGEEATALRSHGANWPLTTIVEHMLTTLSSIADTPGADATTAVVL